MSEESFAQMLDNEEWKEIRTGEVVDGRVIAVKPDRIVLNIGGKSDGIITRSEYTSAPDVDLTTVVSVGDEMKAKVLKSNDGVVRLLLHIESLLQIMAIRNLKMHLIIRSFLLWILLRLIIEVSNFVGLVTNGRYKYREGCYAYGFGHQKASWIFLILSI